MVMTIASAIISLGLVYNVVAGRNKPQSGAASGSPAPSTSSNYREASSGQSWSDANSPSTSFGWQVHPQMRRCCLSAAPHG
jgi:hypothetical protein